MQRFRDLYHTLNELQRKRNTKLALSGVVVVVCAVVFGALLRSSHDIHDKRTQLIKALAGQSLSEQDEYAVAMAEDGGFTLGGVRYGGEEYKTQLNRIFDDQGNFLSVPILTERLLDPFRPAWAPGWMLEQPGTTWMMAAMALAWGLALVWLDLAVQFVLTLIGTTIPVTLAAMFGAEQLTLALAAIGLLTFTYVLLSRLLLLVLNQRIQVFAVAHTLIKEAARTNLSLVFIVGLLIVLPILPLFLDPASPLTHQIQTFISRSLGATFFFAGVLTLFLSCATVSFEIRDRQIWQLMTKPTNRASYLLGKWLGVLCINAMLLTVSGVSTFLFVQYLRMRPVEASQEGQYDAMAVRDEVLTARRGMYPEYLKLTNEEILNRIDQVIENRADLAAMDDVPMAMRRDIAKEIMEVFNLGQRTIPPQQGREFNFTGLDRSRLGPSLTLRYRFHILRSDEHATFPAVFMINDDQSKVVQRTYVPTMSHVLTIPSNFVTEDGSLKISVFNAYQPTAQEIGFGALNFEFDDFEILYKVGGFEANFFRAVVLDWIKLAFLSMLGIACATFLSFSVSCLLAFSLALAAISGPYLADSLSQFYPPSTASMDWGNIGLVIKWAFMWFIKGVAELLVFALRAFGEYSATQYLVQGKYIPPMAILSAFGKLGVVWSGIALAFGWLVLRSRQLAIYSGQG